MMRHVHTLGRGTPLPSRSAVLRVRSTCLLLAMLLCAVLLAGCGGGDAPDPSKVPATKPTPAASPAQVHWIYEPNALELVIYADEQLNTYDGFAHATLLCVYQLATPAAFQQLSSSVDGVAKLLECNSFDASAVHFEKRFIQPGQNGTLSLDRAEKAKHVGLAAGYFDLQPDAVTRIYDIPLHRDETGWLWWSEDEYTPGKLTMRLLLGPHSIQRVGEH